MSYQNLNHQSLFDGSLGIFQFFSQCNEYHGTQPFLSVCTCLNPSRQNYWVQRCARAHTHRVCVCVCVCIHCTNWHSEQWRCCTNFHFSDARGKCTFPETLQAQNYNNVSKKHLCQSRNQNHTILSLLKLLLSSGISEVKPFYMLLAICIPVMDYSLMTFAHFLIIIPFTCMTNLS